MQTFYKKQTNSCFLTIYFILGQFLVLKSIQTFSSLDYISQHFDCNGWIEIPNEIIARKNSLLEIINQK